MTTETAATAEFAAWFRIIYRSASVETVARAWDDRPTGEREFWTAIAAQQPQPAPEVATVDLHRWYAVINQPDGTSKVIGHTSDGLGYYDSVAEWEAATQ